MWTKGKDQYYIVNGAYTICKVFLRGVTTYELWHGDKFIARGELDKLKGMV